MAAPQVTVVDPVGAGATRYRTDVAAELARHENVIGIKEASGDVVTVDAEPAASLCAGWVEDDGTGIPEAQRGAIFARGARLDTEKPGTGLGLAIAKQLVELHGGTVTATSVVMPEPGRKTWVSGAPGS